MKFKITVGNKKRMIAGVGLEPNRVWAPCCKTWLKWKVKILRCRKKKEMKLRKKMFGSWVTPLVGRHVVKHGLKKMKFEFVAEKKCFPGRGLCLTHVGAPCCERSKIT